MTSKNWSGKTDGTPWMQRKLIIIYRAVGLRPMYAIMSLVIPFYMLLRHKSYLAAYRFFRNRMHYGRFKSFINVYRNHYVFGQIVLDRFAAYAGKKFRLNMEGYNKFLCMANGEDGFIMLSSHVGNYEMAGYTLVSEKKPFKALVYSGETATVMENRLRILGHNNISLNPISSDMSHVFVMSDALSNGEILSMSGDRVVGSKTVECMFFGEKAKFPLGPFALAIQRDAKMLAVFVMKQNVDSYQIFIKEIVADKNEKMKNERIRSLAQSFANELECVVKKYPEQWFNYYNFWE